MSGNYAQCLRYFKAAYPVDNIPYITVVVRVRAIHPQKYALVIIIGLKI